MLFDFSEQVRIAGKGIRLFANPDAGSHLPYAETIVYRRRINQRVHVTFAVVIGRLQQCGGFSRIHGGIVEIQFSHVYLSTQRQK